MSERSYEKKSLRSQIISLRDSQKDVEIRLKSEIIYDKLFNLNKFKRAKVIMFYASIKSEVRTDEMIQEAIKLGKRIVLPKTDIDEHQLIPIEIKSIKDDVEEIRYPKFTLREPKGEKMVKSEEIELVVVPAVAFDENCYRLGYGGGFYDRFLKRVSFDIPKIGIGFELQVMEELPTNSNDFPLDIIITEKRIIWRKKEDKECES